MEGRIGVVERDQFVSKQKLKSQKYLVSPFLIAMHSVIVCCFCDWSFDIVEIKILIFVIIQISSDPFKDCRTPTLFAVGSEGRMTSVAYTEVSCNVFFPMNAAHSHNLVVFGSICLLEEVAHTNYRNLTQLSLLMWLIYIIFFVYYWFWRVAVMTTVILRPHSVIGHWLVGSSVWN